MIRIERGAVWGCIGGVLALGAVFAVLAGERGPRGAHATTDLHPAHDYHQSTTDSDASGRQ